MPMRVWEDEESFLAEMRETGCIVGYSLDEDGEEIAEWDLPRTKELFPEVYEVLSEQFKQETDEAIERLLLDGLIEIEPRVENGEPVDYYRLTEKGKEVSQDILKEYGLDSTD